MTHPFGKPAVVCGAAFLLVFGSSGCASKKYVRGQVSPVENRVTGVEKKTTDNTASIGELENGLSRTDEKVTDADKKAVAAGQDAAKANQAAMQAGQQADQANTLAKNGMSRIGEVVENIDNYQLVTTENILFALNKFSLTPEAKSQLDAAVANITTAKNYVLEVQGFTDGTGGDSLNLQLSQRRADTVVRYLNVNHKLPLRKIHVLGVGKDNPVADNSTREGRKQNRRVELKVFALDLGSNPGATQPARSAANED